MTICFDTTEGETCFNTWTAQNFLPQNSTATKSEHILVVQNF